MATAMAMEAAPPAAGDLVPSDSRVIEVRVAELRQLFNAIVAAVRGYGPSDRR
jgi:hypothetical protein